MAAVEKYERVLPQAEENGFSYREFSSTEGTRRKPMPGGKSMLLKLDWLMARGMECVDHGTVSTETKDCTWLSRAARWRSSQVPSCPTTTPAGQTVDSQSNY